MNRAEPDWNTWRPNLEATLLWLFRGEEVLVMRKKRGLGAGKVNAPGGKIHPGESPPACAVREVQEELGVTVLDPRKAGELWFQFTNGLAMRCHVFVGSHFTGEPVETDEGAPFWCHKDHLPLTEMWADDAVWLPWLFSGRPFLGRFVFDEDTMLTENVVDLTP